MNGNAATTAITCTDMHSLGRSSLSQFDYSKKTGQKARLLQCSLHSIDGLQNLSVKFKPNKSNRIHPSILHQQSRLEDWHLRWEIKHVTVTRQKHTFFALWYSKSILHHKGHRFSIVFRRFPWLSHILQCRVCNYVALQGTRHKNIWSMLENQRWTPKRILRAWGSCL